MQRQFRLDEIHEIAQQLLYEFEAKTSYAFFAEMGSGKTTLIHAICDTLGVKDNVSSPTFSIINEYEIEGSNQKVYHMDWYRLKHTEDAIEAGVQDVLMQTEHYSFIEWPEIAADLLPNDCVKITLSLVDENTRRIDAIVG
jgi:tRNA threonylcarbamoyladenosine biosynthesis protein TsaE